MSATRRFARFLLDIGAPFVWLFALIGAALIAFPPWSMWTAGDAEGWPSAGVLVEMTDGDSLFPLGVDPNFWSPHPRALTVGVLGGPVTDGDPGPEPNFNDARWLWWTDDPGGVRWPVAGLVSGVGRVHRGEFLKERPYSMEVSWADPGPLRRLYGLGVSLWPLLTLAAAVAAVGWRRRRRAEGRGRTHDEHSDAGGDEGSDGPPRGGGRRRLLRPWVLLAAGVGAFATVGAFVPAGPGLWVPRVSRGPADAPHPRVLELAVFWTTPPPAFVRRGGDRRAARPTAGLWFRHFVVPAAQALTLDWYGATAVALSLWWLVAAGLAANAVTLWRAWRRGRRMPG